MKDILYDTRWQTLRVSMNGRWNKKASVNHCLQRLLAYLEEPVTAQELYFRVTRVLNLLHMVRTGKYGNERLEGDSDYLIYQFCQQLKDIQLALEAKFVRVHFPEWNWDEQLRQLKKLYSYDVIMFGLVLTDLEARLQKSTPETQPGLAHFVQLMHEVQKSFS